MTDLIQKSWLIEPKGKAHELPAGITHVDYAKELIHKPSIPLSLNHLLEAGWMRVAYFIETSNKVLVIQCKDYSIEQLDALSCIWPMGVREVMYEIADKRFIINNPVRHFIFYDYFYHHLRYNISS